MSHMSPTNTHRYGQIEQLYILSQKEEYAKEFCDSIYIIRLIYLEQPHPRTRVRIHITVSGPSSSVQCQHTHISRTHMTSETPFPTHMCSLYCYVRPPDKSTQRTIAHIVRAEHHIVIIAIKKKRPFALNKLPDLCREDIFELPH